MSFRSIIGHKNEISYLEEVLKSNRISSSYLFIGPERIGKRLVAMNFAKVLNCTSKEGPCDNCLPCRKIENLNFPDLYIVRPLGKGNVIKIESIRDLKKEASLKPYEGRYKVFIIDDADSLTQESGNALLKILEEVPPSTVFILITSNVTRILPTIISRCRTIRFKPVSSEEILRVLIKDYKIKEEEAIFLARFSAGKIGQAIKMKELDTINKKNMLIDKILQFLRDPKSIDRNAQWSYIDRKSLKDDLEILLSWFRDLSISKTDPDKGLLYNIDRFKDIQKESDRYNQEDLESIINKIIMLDFYIDANVNTKLIVDALLDELEGEVQCTR